MVKLKFGQSDNIFFLLLFHTVTNLPIKLCVSYDMIIVQEGQPIMQIAHQEKTNWLMFCRWG